MNGEESGGVLSRSLSQRLREHTDSVLPLVLEAFLEGRRAGVASVTDDLLERVVKWLAAAERQYEGLGLEGAEAIAQMYGTSRPVVEAHFGATGATLAAVRDEIRRARCQRGGRGEAG